MDQMKKQIADCTEDMLCAIGRLVKYNSVQGEAKPGMPFGEEPAKVLSEALQIARELGFRTVNLDNYCGYAEMGEGEEIIGIAGHLDIVPAGEGWSYDPFTLTRVGDKVYGRGTTDDKGPVVENLYAMKLIRDSGRKLGKRVRLIMGCNEETGSKCMAHYNEVAEPLTMGYTPDANFPCIHGEKAGAALRITSKKTRILSMNGGFVFNAVCDRCTTVIPAGSVSATALRAALAATPLVSATVTEEGETLTIFAQGVAAHASMPHLGVNAASYTMQALQNAGFADDFVDYYMERIGTACDGSGCGINFRDEFGALTFNNGIVKTENGAIVCMIDCRVPVTVRREQVIHAAAAYADDARGTLEVLHVGESIFYPKDSALVQALYQAYVDVTGDTEHQPEVIGGGTYAKSLKGIIAFGPELPGEDYRIHNADEFLTVSGMQRSTEVYYTAIVNMLQSK